jgi:hypothetical protein
MTRGNASPKNVYPDGTNGIDNSWGKLVLPIVLGVASDFSTQANAQITAGKATTLFTLRKLGAGTDYNPLSAAQYLSTDLGMAPKLDGTDMYPIDPASLTNPTDVSTPAIVFASGYVSGNTWVSGVGGSTITLGANAPSFANFVLPGNVPLQVTRIAMTLSADHKTATNGTISGVIPIAPYEAAMREAAGRLDSALCTGATIDSIIAQIDQASDILQDGTQDPTKQCDGISVGFGFNATIVQIGSIGVATPPLPNPCNDGGP